MNPLPSQSVWLVTQVDTSPYGGSHDVYGLVGVFSTEEKAEAWMTVQPPQEGIEIIEVESGDLKRKFELTEVATNEEQR